MKQNENTKYVKLGITGASVLAFGFAIMYILNQSQNIASGIRGIFNILKPFLYGALIAYILAPMCNRMDDRFLKWFPNATEKQKKGTEISVYRDSSNFSCDDRSLIASSDSAAGMGQYSQDHQDSSGETRVL